MKRAISLLVVAALLIAVSGIGGDSMAQVIVEQPAVVEVPTVVETPVVVQTPTVIEEPVVLSPTYVPIPPPQQEVVTAAPSLGAVWVAGHWDRTLTNWVWTPGAWVTPPAANASWVPGYWQHQGGQFVWENPHWAMAAEGVIVAKPVEIPPAYVEIQPAAPASTTALTWQPGYWQWRGTWVWIPGVYVQTVVPTATWVAGQWLQGVDGWRWIPAHWQG